MNCKANAGFSLLKPGDGARQAIDFLKWHLVLCWEFGSGCGLLSYE
jgi:hypothetical protein